MVKRVFIEDVLKSRRKMEKLVLLEKERRGVGKVACCISGWRT